MQIQGKFNDQVLYCETLVHIWYSSVVPWTVAEEELSLLFAPHPALQDVLLVPLFVAVALAELTPVLQRLSWGHLHSFLFVLLVQVFPAFFHLLGISQKLMLLLKFLASWPGLLYLSSIVTIPGVPAVEDLRRRSSTESVVVVPLFWCWSSWELLG